MLDNLIQQFAGGAAQSLEGSQLHDNVGQMLSAAPENEVKGAVSQALGALGPQGFAQSVQQGAERGGPEGRSALAGVLLDAVEKGGGSRGTVASQFGGEGGMGAGQLASLAEHVFNNHGDALAGVLGSQLNSGGGGSGGVLSLLGNPMVRQVGEQLAGRLL